MHDEGTDDLYMEWESKVMLINPDVFYEVFRARVKAHEKHGDQSIEATAARSSRWLSILVEEVGEVAHELTYDAKGSLRAELIDVLAVASAWVDALDRDTARRDSQRATCCATPAATRLPTAAAVSNHPIQRAGADS